MGERIYLHEDQYQTLDRNPDEDFASYILRSIDIKAARYTREDRVKLAKMQMELIEETIVDEAEIDDEDLFYLETLIAAHDFGCTFQDVGSEEYNQMLDNKRRLVKFIHSRLKRKGLMPKTAQKPIEIITETEALVREIAPIREITKRLQAEIEKIRERMG